MSTKSSANGERQFLQWFRRHAWKPFKFQRETWAAYLAGHSGLIHSPTGTAKPTPLPFPLEWLNENPDPPAWPKAVPLRVLWITPLRALANDTAQSLLAPIADLALPWTIELRTGDTSAATRTKQRARLPSVLITTPESLSRLLSYPGTRETMGSLRSIIVDEWHELLGTKRGLQNELCLARLRSWFPNLKTWGLSATLGNLEQALAVPVGRHLSEDLRRSPNRQMPSKHQSKVKTGRLVADGTGKKRSSGERRACPAIPRFARAFRPAYVGYCPVTYLSRCSIVAFCAERVHRTKSPIETMPASFSFSSTGRCRILFSVMMAMHSFTVLF